jgi:hypothetical protein
MKSFHHRHGNARGISLPVIIEKGKQERDLLLAALTLSPASSTSSVRIQVFIAGFHHSPSTTSPVPAVERK